MLVCEKSSWVRSMSGVKWGQFLPVESAARKEILLCQGSIAGLHQALLQIVVGTLKGIHILNEKNIEKQLGFTY